MMERVTNPADPRRCKGQTEAGQCWNLSEEGSERCRAHVGKDSGRSKRTYQLHKAQYQRRLTELSDDEKLTSLREEIALIRMLVEERMNLVRNDSDFLSAFGPVQQALITVERLTKSLHQMEQSLGNLLNKSAVIGLGQTLSRIITEELREVQGHEQIVDRVNERMLAAITELQNPDE